MKMKCLIYYTCFIFLFIHKIDGRVEKRCGSIDIRNDPKLGFGASYKFYKGCTVLDGDFTMSMITKNTYTDEDFPVFPELREITGCILMYQVRGVTTLGRIFPNLRVIGGGSLIMNYALVIYQNPDLLNIGLENLTVIRNGGVRITENPKLCYARFINWDAILAGKIRDIIVETGMASAFKSNLRKTGMVVSTCGEKYGCDSKDKQCHTVNNVVSCWNNSTCQSFCQYHNNTAGPGCSTTGEKCHDECIGGCDLPDNPKSCHACRYVEYKGECLKKCPDDMFEMLERRCVTQEECDNMSPVVASTNNGDRLVWKAFGKKCHYECPPTYKEDEEDPRKCRSCNGLCPKKCRGLTVDSIGEALKLKGCNIIEGNLEVEIKLGIETTSAEKFAEAFGSITDISGYLLVRFSPAFTSLFMFKNLSRIHGKTLYHDKYALVVYENQNLNQLFNTEQTPLKVLNGTVNFQNNRYLCMEKVEALINHLQLQHKITDLSTFSNGDKAVCNISTMEIKQVTPLQNGFVILWTKFDTDNLDYRKFLGYQVFYKKVDRIDPNMSIDDDRSACADSWQMQFVEAVESSDKDNNQAVVFGEPNTLYAYYVQTRLINHNGARTSISKINFIRTLFDEPSPPRITIVTARGPNEIFLKWDEPIKPNGEITYYTVQWVRAIDETQSQYKSNPCEDSSYSHAIISTPKTLLGDDTCSADKGCCKCDDVPKETSNRNEVSLNFDEITENKRLERAQFENAVQNIVFVQSCDFDTDGRHCQHYRAKRHQHSNKPTNHRNNNNNNNIFSTLKYNSNVSGKVKSTKRIRRSIENVLLGKNSDVGRSLYPTYGHTEHESNEVNTTRNGIIITGLQHYTEYNIKVAACQDPNVPSASCSNINDVSIFVRTQQIPSNDLINPETVIVEDYNATSRPDMKIISWDFPKNPNGELLAFRVKIWQGSGNTPIEQCVLLSDYDAKKGVIFSGLNNGKYSVEIKTITLAGISESTLLMEFFDVFVPGWLTWDKILYITTGLIIIIISAVLIGYHYIRRHFGKKVQEYLRQTISANPEYLSQLDVYKTDEWELKRDDLILHEEIGRGTFGKVFRGTGKNITSVCGINFGKCAIKTVPECATNAERLHFLIEASVMKQFNTSFIVKLYGVVSDGQPVLVVMEMMDSGNLRDYLRARRPDSEENIDNAPLPSMISYFKWATQIADGMSYLESLKFVHRDLAARNCMVSFDETVKIGDFGMARDIYYHEYYKPAGKRLMPVRWMAPESLKDGKFTVKSDVWSYGIVLYEMLTLGQQPYAGLGNDQVFNYIGVKRNILVRPVGCPDFWYDLMRVCWKYDPRDRPSFYQIVLHLKNTIENAFKDSNKPIREQGLAVFDKCYVIQNFDNIPDEMYDFSYNEDEEEARKHKMLKELEQLQNEEEDEYYKQGFGASNVANDSCPIGENEEGNRFNVLMLQDLTQSDKPEKTEILTKKQIKARDKERERFHKKQKELREKRTKEASEEIELTEQNSPIVKKINDKPEIMVINEKDEPKSPNIKLKKETNETDHLITKGK